MRIHRSIKFEPIYRKAYLPALILSSVEYFIVSIRCRDAKQTYRSMPQEGRGQTEDEHSAETSSDEGLPSASAESRVKFSRAVLMIQSAFPIFSWLYASFGVAEGQESAPIGSDFMLVQSDLGG